MFLAVTNEIELLDQALFVSRQLAVDEFNTNCHARGYGLHELSLPFVTDDVLRIADGERIELLDVEPCRIVEFPTLHEANRVLDLTVQSSVT